ncbi:SWIM zinc finger family protein [Brucella pituitosa]|uniref:SWIM zinc finger family protein n=1 Tax=Brucella pituitosa TaxID=571256 RepID=UPI000C27BF03|nr:SWIM zinc finger family protein [Brucella pituitosa]PJO47201.1 hypothetical protein CWE02_19245 [Brucella pituitosa]
MFVFEVQGSAATPYTVTAQGEGQALFIKCTCIAWVRGGSFCKHVASVLVGDVTALVSGSADIEALAKAAKGTHYEQLALSHKPSGRPRVEGIKTFQDLYDRYHAALVAAGWVVEWLKAATDERREGIYLFAQTKAGKQRKHPKISICFEEWSYEDVWNEDDTFTRVVKGKSPKPWRVEGKAYGSLATAIPVFLKAGKVSV